MKTDPLQRSVKAAYRASVVGQFQALLDERSKWSRKRTIADNKLQDVDHKIRLFGSALADEAQKAGRMGKVLP